MVRFNPGAIAVGAILLVAIAGCAPSDPAPSPRHTDTAPHVSAPTPTPTPLALSQLVISPDGLGPIIVGQPISAEAAFEASAVFNPHHCGVDGSNYPDWESADQTDATYSIDLKGTTAADPIDGVEAESHDIATDKGIDIGSSLSDLTAAYPKVDSIIRTPNSGSDLYILRGADGQLSIEVTTNRAAAYWTADEVDKVLTMSAWRLTDTPTGFANSDVEMGGCS